MQVMRRQQCMPPINYHRADWRLYHTTAQHSHFKLRTSASNVRRWFAANSVVYPPMNFHRANWRLYHNHCTLRLETIKKNVLVLHLMKTAIFSAPQTEPRPEAHGNKDN